MALEEAPGVEAIVERSDPALELTVREPFDQRGVGDLGAVSAGQIDP